MRPGRLARRHRSRSGRDGRHFVYQRPGLTRRSWSWCPRWPAVAAPFPSSSRRDRPTARRRRNWRLTIIAPLSDPSRHSCSEPTAVVSIDAERQPAPGLPPRERLFSMMVRDGDVTSSSNYTAMKGVLKGVGRKAQIYVADRTWRTSIRNWSRTCSPPSTIGFTRWRRVGLAWRVMSMAMADSRSCSQAGSITWEAVAIPSMASCAWPISIPPFNRRLATSAI